MKRLTGALLIAVLFLFLNISAENKMEKSCGDISSSLEVCANHINNGKYNESLRVLEDIRAEWRENQIIMGIVLGNISFRNAGIDITTVYNCIKDKNYAQALLIIREIQSCFNQAVEDRRLNIGNIL